MEVHHHPHPGHKKFKEYLLEGLMIFVAVTLGFHRLGLLRSNPIACIPNWKWEGYAEYIARGSGDATDLRASIARYLNTTDDAWEVKLPDKTIAPKEYYRYMILVQYCLTQRSMHYQQLLADTTRESAVQAQMMHWYKIAL